MLATNVRQLGPTYSSTEIQNFLLKFKVQLSLLRWSFVSAVSACIGCYVLGLLCPMSLLYLPIVVFVWMHQINAKLLKPNCSQCRHEALSQCGNFRSLTIIKSFNFQRVIARNRIKILMLSHLMRWQPKNNLKDRWNHSGDTVHLSI